MAAYIYWFLLALMLFAAEMATGTFYLLVLGIAMGIGGIAAVLGASLPTQITLCATAGLIGTVILRRTKIARHEPAENQNLDIGQVVRVVLTREDGTLRVAYRGSEWDAELISTEYQPDQPLYIQSMRGSTLVLSHQIPPR